MLDGAHIIIYSTNADADRAFLADVLELPSVDVGDGWLIFALPPAELAVHPSDAGSSHELYFMCPDVEKLVAELGARGVACEPIANRGWGLLTSFTLPSGNKLSAYQPRHARPSWPSANKTATRPAAKPRRAKPAPAKRAKPAPAKRAKPAPAKRAKPTPRRAAKRR
jgi:hypothetical protein